MDTGINAAILLLTCDRPAETKKTLESMSKHIDLSRFILLHGDDASRGTENCLLAWSHGFKTVVRPGYRRGVCFMWSSLIAKAAELGVEWVICQENDWTWNREFPYEIMHTVDKEKIYYIRLFGEYKEANNTRPCNPNHMGKDKPAAWRDYDTNWQIGDTHWGFPGNITLTREAVKLTSGIRNEREAIKRSAGITKSVLRPKENYIFHIGSERTPGFKT